MAARSVAWLLAAHVSELAAPGAYQRLELAGESILITRDDDGRLHAFYNVCPHRGAQLCAQPRGHADEFRCPYHHWTYARDGQLPRAPGAGPAALEPDGRPLSLRPLHCAERFGFVWISMAARPPDLDAHLAHLAPIAAGLTRYRPQDYRLVYEDVIELDANWKASVDVNNEGYHLPTLHPELRELVAGRAARFTARGDHSTIALPIARPARPLADVATS